MRTIPTKQKGGLMTKLMKAIKIVSDRNKLNAIISGVSLVMCLLMILILGITYRICDTIETVKKKG